MKAEMKPCEKDFIHITMAILTRGHANFEFSTSVVEIMGNVTPAKHHIPGQAAQA